MSDSSQISERDAIRQIISESNAMDYVDVVHAVKKRFRLDVSSAQVEQVAQDLVKHKSRIRPDSRVSVALTAKIPEDSAASDSTNLKTTETQADLQLDRSKDNLVQALQFVKSVGSLANAKRALEELETILIGHD